MDRIGYTFVRGQTEVLVFIVVVFHTGQAVHIVLIEITNAKMALENVFIAVAVLTVLVVRIVQLVCTNIKCCEFEHERFAQRKGKARHSRSR